MVEYWAQSRVAMMVDLKVDMKADMMVARKEIQTVDSWGMYLVAGMVMNLVVLMVVYLVETKAAKMAAYLERKTVVVRVGDLVAMRAEQKIAKMVDLMAVM